MQINLAACQHCFLPLSHSSKLDYYLSISCVCWVQNITGSLPAQVFPWSLAPLHSPWWSPGKTCFWQTSWWRWRRLRWPFQRRHTSCRVLPSSWSDRTWFPVSEWQQPGRCFCLSYHCGEDSKYSNLTSLWRISIFSHISFRFIYISLIKKKEILGNCKKKRGDITQFCWNKQFGNKKLRDYAFKSQCKKK